MSFSILPRLGSEERVTTGTDDCFAPAGPRAAAAAPAAATATRDSRSRGDRDRPAGDARRRPERLHRPRGRRPLRREAGRGVGHDSPLRPSGPAGPEQAGGGARRRRGGAGGEGIVMAPVTGSVLVSRVGRLPAPLATSRTPGSDEMSQTKTVAHVTAYSGDSVAPRWASPPGAGTRTR